MAITKNRITYPERFLMFRKVTSCAWWSITSTKDTKSEAKMAMNGKLMIPIVKAYNNMLNWKFMASLPWLLTKGFSLFTVHNINGRIKFPKGKKYFEKVDRWINAATFLWFSERLVSIVYYFPCHDRLPGYANICLLKGNMLRIVLIFNSILTNE